MTTDPTGETPTRQEQDAAALPAETTDRPASPAGSAGPSGGAAAPGRPPGSGFTRASAAWVAVAVSLLFLVLLIVFILQNGAHVHVSFLWFGGSLPLGVALLIAAVTGGVVVAIAGAARVVQLRHAAKRAVRR